LSQAELYWRIPRIIAKYAEEWNLEKYKEKLINTWKRLSTYTHFSKEFFNLALYRPEEIWMEHYNQKLLKECCELYITTIDLFFSVLVISFPNVMKSIKNIVEWWKNNLTIELKITNRVLSEIQKLQSNNHN